MTQTIYLLLGDCREQSAKLRAKRGNGFLGAMVADPPYDLTSSSGGGGFMGKAWDATGVAFEVATWEEVLKALEPGGILKVFSATRTNHRMLLAIEQAGFVGVKLEAWVQGEGFPKGLNISKALDKMAGAEREVVGKRSTNRNRPITDRWEISNEEKESVAFGDGKGQTVDVTIPATEAAKQWEGYNVALKPSWEPIIVARKPKE